jgi:hypothetical protein
MARASGGPRTLSGDPRSIVTPDAFTVATELLGTPLASPGRRLGAILVDLVVVGVLTALTKSFALVLGVVVAVLFIRAGFKRISVPGSVFGRAMRASVGCLGVFVGLVTLVLWMSLGIDLGRSGDTVRVSAPGLAPAGADLGTAIAGATSGLAFANAPDLETAAAAGRRVVEVGRDLGLGPSEMRELLKELIPQEADWAGESEALIAQLLQSGLPSGDSSSAGAPESAPPTASGDSIEALLGRMRALEGELRQARQDDDSESGGFVSGLRGLVDELGFGFGWATLYMTVMLSWWRGQTVGKRVFGIRVVRLDGEAMTWWAAFERAGGYAAGFATGLLGFVQVYWDANRQAIHDRIAGTVVVREGLPKVQGWESVM